MTDQEKQNMLNQVSATMAIENMQMSSYDKQNANDIIAGNKTIEQVRKELDKKYNER